MKFLFFKLTSRLKESLEILNHIEGAAIQDDSADAMKILNELFIVHKELFRLLERVESLDKQQQQRIL